MNERERSIETERHQAEQIQRIADDLQERLRLSQRENEELRNCIEMMERRSRHDHGLRNGFDRAATEAGLPELFDEIAGRIRDSGWSKTVEDYVHGRGSGGSMTVIPGQGESCTETVVVFITSEDRPRHWTKLGGHGDEMEALKMHLVECPRVRRVLILTDTLVGTSFRHEHLRCLRAWSNRGVAFALGFVGPDGRTTVPLPLGL